MTHIEATPGHNIGIIPTTHDGQVSHTGATAIDPAVTHHINPTTDCQHTGIPHDITPEIKVEHIHILQNLKMRFP